MAEREISARGSAVGGDAPAATRGFVVIGHSPTQRCPSAFIGHLLDTYPVALAKSLISLARPTGIEPVFPP